MGRITATETKLPGNEFKDLDYTYDEASNRLSVRPANSKTYNYKYDDSSRMTLVEDGSRDLAKYTYDQIGRRTKLVLSYRSSAENTVTYNYEPDGALDSLTHAFDDSDNNVDYSFDYNLANQVSFRTVDNQTFQFAPVAREETYTANGLNQYTQIIKDTVLIGLTYDANGNLTGDGTWTYTYDVENRLINANDGVTDVDYVYDPLGRRVKKSGVGVTARLFLSDGTNEVLEMTTSGSIQARYVYGPGVDEPIMTWQTSSTSLGNMRFYRADPQGSIVALTDRDGEVEDTYTYDAYGNPDDPGGQPIRYTGRRWDPETGLYYYRSRYYNPALGRFLQTDPVGYADNTNLYGYVGNDPASNIDPSGTVCGTRIKGKAGAGCSLSRSGLTTIQNKSGTNSQNTGTKTAQAGSTGAQANSTSAPGTQGTTSSQQSSQQGNFVNPTGGAVRGCDNFGCGNFGSSRAGGSRLHKGTDFVSTKGQDVVSVASGEVIKIGYPYGNDLTFRYVRVETPNGDVVTQMYVAPDASIIVGAKVQAGQLIGTAQTLQNRYPGITDHIHVEIEINGKLVDPEKVIP